MSYRAEVFCRVRPTDKLCLQQFHFSPNNRTVEVTRKNIRNSCSVGKGSNDQEVIHTFTFDSIFAGSNATQENVFRATAMKLVQKGLLEGINSTLLCHGQRDSGKTYTMFGGNDFRSRGLAARTITQLYEDVQHYSMERTYTIKISFLQFYGSEVTDLLTGMTSTAGRVGGSSRCGSRGGGSSNALSKSSSTRIGSERSGSCTSSGEKNPPFLSPSTCFPSGSSSASPAGERCLPQVTLDGKGEVLLKGIEKRVCSNEEEALATVFEGLHNRSLNKNVHVVLSLYARHQSLVDSECETRDAVLHLVDLAGIQRGDGLSSDHRGEVQVVNRSLSMLEQVILCLGNPQTSSSGEAVKSHIPYRQSKLTTLLKGCIGGTSLTSLIAHIYPEQQFLEATISTLNFARRMMHLVIEPTVNVVQDASTQIRSLQRQVTDLKAEIRMQNQLSLARAARQSPSSNSAENSSGGEGGSHQKGGGGNSVHSSTTTYGTDELQAIHEKAQMYLDGESSTIYVNDVREMNACFAYFRQLLEQKNLYITEIQSEAYSKAQTSYQRERGNESSGTREGDGLVSIYSTSAVASGFSSPIHGPGQDNTGGRGSFGGGNKSGNNASGSSINASKGLAVAHRRRAPSSHTHPPSTSNSGYASSRQGGKDGVGAGSGGGAGPGTGIDLHTPNVLDKHGGVSYGVAGKAAQANPRAQQPVVVSPPSLERDRNVGFSSGGGSMGQHGLSTMSSNSSFRGIGQIGGSVGSGEGGTSGPTFTTSYSTSSGVPGSSASNMTMASGGYPPENHHNKPNLTISTNNGIGGTGNAGKIFSSAGHPQFSSLPEARPPGALMAPAGNSSRPAQGSALSSPSLQMPSSSTSGPSGHDNQTSSIIPTTSTASKPSTSFGSSNPQGTSSASGISSTGSRFPVPPLPLLSQASAARPEASQGEKGDATAEHMKARAFDDYKKNSNGALQVRALAEDQEQLLQMERKLNGLYRRLEKIDMAFQEKAQRHRSPQSAFSPSAALLSHASAYSGGSGGRGNRPHSSGSAGYQGSDEDDDPYRMTQLQLSVYYSATEENIKALSAERSHLIKQMERRQQAFLTNFLEWYGRISGDTSELGYELGGRRDSAAGKQFSSAPGIPIGHCVSGTTAGYYSGVGLQSGQFAAGTNSGRSSARRGLPQTSFVDGNTTSSPGIRSGGTGGGMDSNSVHLPSVGLSGGMLAGAAGEAAGPLFYQLQDDRFLDAAERFDAMEMQRRTAQDPQSRAFYSAKKFVESKTRDQGRVGNRA